MLQYSTTICNGHFHYKIITNNQTKNEQASIKGTTKVKANKTKYTMDLGQLNLSQQYENNCWSKMIFEQKLAISKIWAKKGLKIAKNGGFP